MPEKFTPDVDVNTDEAGDKWMHTNDPASVTWVVTVVGRKGGDNNLRVVEERSVNSPGFPARGYATSLSAWSVPYMSGSDYCHIEIADGGGNVHFEGDCPHQPDRPNAHLRSLQLPKTQIGSEPIASHWCALPNGCLITTIESDEGTTLAALTTDAWDRLELSVRGQVLWRGLSH